MTLGELHLIGTMRYAMGDFPSAIEMVHRNEIDLDTLILRRFALPEIPEVFKETLQFPERVLRSIMVA